jgi:hypothetical protein
MCASCSSLGFVLVFTFGELGVAAGALSADVYTSVIIMVAVTTIITPIWLKMVYRKDDT